MIIMGVTQRIMQNYRLIISCPDQVGLVARVTDYIASFEGSLIEASNHTDVENGWFFMRLVINAHSLRCDLDTFREGFAPIAKHYQMKWYIRDSKVKQKVVVLASHASHCLADLLHRWHSDELDCEISCVVSNHDNLQSMVEWHNIPFHYVPVNGQNKPQAFDAIEEIVESYNAETIVLARFMQVIPPRLCEKYADRLINIHHSFLPSFVGANPYQKAFERGVKLIGATSHYVTQDLDEGPIIEQDVVRVNHRHSKEDLIRMGKDVERSVLASALRNHLADRVIVLGNKTIVFE